MQSVFHQPLLNKDLLESLGYELERELKSIVVSFGAGEEIWNSRKTTAQTIESMDLAPAVNVYADVFNFREAMETELVWLRDNGVVSGLTDADINHQTCF